MPRVQIIVKNQDGKILQGVDVELEGYGTQQTGANGIADFPNIPSGGDHIVTARPTATTNTIPPAPLPANIVNFIPPGQPNYSESKGKTPTIPNVAATSRVGPYQIILEYNVTHKDDLKNISDKINKELKPLIERYDAESNNPKPDHGLLRKLGSEIEGKSSEITKTMGGLKLNTDHPLFQNFTKTLGDFNSTNKQFQDKHKSTKESAQKKGRDKGATIFQKGQGWNPLTWVNPEWWRENWYRFVLATGFWLALLFLFYFPLFDAVGFTNPVFKGLLPAISWFILFFVLKPPPETNWGAAIMATLLGAASFFGIWWTSANIDEAAFLGARYLLFGIPLAVGLISWRMSQGERGALKTLTTVGGVLLVTGVLVMFIILAKGGKLTELETYLKPLDVLKLIGVPSETVENMKEGIRSALSFLRFKSVEPTKPEAEKIGGFEAIQLKFGSSANNFATPTLFARLDYTLPVTIVNPNKLETKLAAQNFVIDNTFLNNRTNRIFCGSIGGTESLTGKVPVGDINPEEEKSVTIDFKDKTNCETVVKSFSNVPNPMYPAKFSVPYYDATENNDNADCTEVCKVIGNEIVNKHNIDYGLSPGGDRIDATNSKYLSSDSQCECGVNRVHNVVDELCFFDDNKAQVTLKSSYDFKVQGKGELILVDKEANKKLAPKPTITSSAGPLTVAVYFISGIHIFEQNKQVAKTMFIEIKNDGDGTAKLKDLKLTTEGVKNANVLGTVPLDSQRKISIQNCSPDPIKVSIDKEAVTIVCSLTPIEESAKSLVTGTYKTLPVIVDIEYAYSQTHSQTIGIKKESIPDGLEVAQIKELDARFNSLPYYCPNEHSENNGGKKAVKIYDVSTRPACAQITTEKFCKNLGCKWEVVKEKGTCNGQPTQTSAQITQFS